MQPMEFSRYSYNAGTDTYTLDFTVNIEGDERSETLVFDKGADGRFWATWVQQPTAGAGRQVLVSHTNGTCADRDHVRLDGSGANRRSSARRRLHGDQVRRLHRRHVE